jgi:predicted phosphodiesterase
MRLAVFSDIHGNYEAFKQILVDLDASDVDRTVCLGDCIGYGPQPEEVVAEIRRRNIPTIIGNHEMAVCDETHLNWFNPLARQSLRKSLSWLSEDSLAFIRQLPYSLTILGCRCVHGFPPDSARIYLFQKSQYELKKTFETLEERICFVGHTHDLEIVQYDGSAIQHHGLRQGLFELNQEHRYIINVGSVGQPRDGDNHAKYVIYDQVLNCLEIKFIPYDIANTVTKIKAAGLPEQHANRLW